MYRTIVVLCIGKLCPEVAVDFLSARVGLVHIGVFILLLLSGERNFGVRLNKPYTASVPMDIPVFTGTHADLLVIVSLVHLFFVCVCVCVLCMSFASGGLQVFHKIVTTGHQRLQPLFDCLLTIIVNGESVASILTICWR